MIRFAVPPIGGRGWFGGWMYMANMVRTLAEHGDRDIETILFLGPDREADPIILGLRGLDRTRIVVADAFSEDRVRAGAMRALASGRNKPILQIYQREGVDVAFCPALYLGWRSETASIAWFPDFQHRRLPHMFSRAAWWKRELGFRAQVASSQMVMLSSNDAEADCLTYYPAAQGRTCVARFAVPVESWPDTQTALGQLRAHNIPDDFIFLPNQFWQHKNHRIAIEAAAILAAQGSKKQIFVSGHGEDPRRPGFRAELEALVIARKAQHNIKFLGNVDHDLVKAMVTCTTALLNPSLFEGWSTTVEEAKAVGTPLILSDLPVHREQAPDATFFDPDDATALASALAATAPRSASEIISATASAKRATVDRQKEYGDALVSAIRNAASIRRSN